MAKPPSEWTDEEIEQAARGSRALRALSALCDSGGQPETRPSDVRRVLEAAEAAGVADEAMRARAATLLEQMEPQPTRHGPSGRGDALRAVIARAAAEAEDPDDWQSVWAALVRLAESRERPAPLLGFVEGEGVKYTGARDEAEFLNREAFRARWKRGRKRT